MAFSSRSRTAISRLAKPAAAAGAFAFAGAFSPASSSSSSSPRTSAPVPLTRWIPADAVESFDVVIVGGGIVGLATAREVSRRHPELKVAVLEKNAGPGAEQSSHNSGVIHAGMYYQPGSTMAETCVTGAAKMYEYCASKGIRAPRVGKLIVAVDEAEHAIVERLYSNGVQNGVQDLRVLSGDEVRAMEPAVSGAYSALWSPNTGIVDYGEVCRALAADVTSRGPERGQLLLSFEAREFAVDAATGDVLVAGGEPGQPGPVRRIRAKRVITCAGLYADRVGRAAGGDSDPKIATFRGTYYQLKPDLRDLVKSNVYPVPSGGGIPVGVHFTPALSKARGEQLIVGPGACPTFSRRGYRFFDVSLRDMWDSFTNLALWKFALANPDLSLGELYRDLSRRAFLRSAQKLVPSLTEDMVEESFSGVMAQVFEPTGTAAKDYIFERGAMGGRVLNVRNAPSPACTASLAIAEKVVSIAEEDFGWKRG